MRISTLSDALRYRDQILSSDGIIAALTRTPAVIPNGSAAAPGLALANSTTTGFYRPSADLLGIAVEGLQHTNYQYQNVLGTNDGALTRMGRQQSHSAGSAAYAYPVTVFVETQTISNNTPIVCYDIGLVDVRVSDTTTQTIMSATTELDKADVYGDGGAVSFTAGWAGLNLRLPQAKTNVTFARAIGQTFTIPSSAGVTGTHTDSILIHFPNTSGAASSNYYGIYQDVTYNGATLAAAGGADIKILGGANGTGGSSNIILNSLTAGSVVDIMTVNRLLMRFSTVGASENNIIVSANNTPLIQARHATGANNVGIQLSSQSAGSVDFLTGSGTLTQVRVTHTASANRNLTLTGSNSGNPTIGTSAGLVAFGAAIVLPAGTTSAASLNAPHGSAPTSPVDGDIWTTTAGLFVRINGSTVGPLS